ncbi:MAG: pilus assembly protein TadE [Pseudonocardiales bacterium]|nr:MAG: pilus assembly protein TadE [Pseudonocardiales bacterium]
MGRWRPAERGAAVVDFVLVSILLIALLLGVVQVGVYVHVRNVLAASAAAGARYGAGANVRSPGAGAAKAADVVHLALGARVSDNTTCVGRLAAGAGGTTLVRVDCSARVPVLLSWLGPLRPIQVTARSLEEG